MKESQLAGFLVAFACLLSGCIQPRFGEPVNLGAPVNTAADENGPFLYFGSTRPDGLGGMDIWQAKILDREKLGL